MIYFIKRVSDKVITNEMDLAKYWNGFVRKSAFRVDSLRSRYATFVFGDEKDE
jgi:hypothetical protein